MKIQSPWMGRVKGSAGNMTGSKVYDKNVLRAKAFEVSNPNTQAQQTERNFFAQVADCCASVSEEQLRSLFGVKPKSMSRRNALTKQLSAAFTIDGNEKVLDFSKLPAIGSGEKINVPIYEYKDGNVVENYDVLLSQFGSKASIETNVIFVGFDSDENKIIIFNSSSTLQESPTPYTILYGGPTITNGFLYPTCAADGSNVSLRGFGSFIIKTRAEK